MLADSVYVESSTGGVYRITIHLCYYLHAYLIFENCDSLTQIYLYKNELLTL